MGEILKGKSVKGTEVLKKTLNLSDAVRHLIQSKQWETEPADALEIT